MNNTKQNSPYINTDWFGIGAETDVYVSVKRASWVGVIVNFLLFIVKLWGGIVSHSAALVSDAIHSLLDVISSVTVLVGIKISNSCRVNIHSRCIRKLRRDAKG